MMHQQDEWDGTERRGVDGIALQLMAEVRKAMEKHEKAEASEMNELKAMIKERDEAGQKRHDDLGKRFDAMQQSTASLLFENNKTTSEIHKLFKAAFPDGDSEAHRKAHERWIEKDKAEREFWIKLKGDAIRWALTAVAAWAVLALWSAFLKGPTP